VILLLEPFGGLAGDMLLAALLDLGDERFGLEDLRGLAAALVPGEVRLEATRVLRGGFAATHLAVHTGESHHPPHRHLSDLLALLEGGRLSPGVRTRAGAVLTRLARAEAEVHGVDVERVHFHEVGAVDTLIDVCGAALALERLGVTRVLATAPYVGGGTVRCAHGEMPVPAPGTAALLRGIPQRRGPGGERVTPTAAALLAELVEAFDSEESLVPEALGTGAGSRDPDEGPPNVVRVQLARASGPGTTGVVWELACNLDDTTGEEVAFVIAELQEAGALDVWWQPIHAKKGRPGVRIGALARPGIRGALEAVLFRGSPTLGVRWWRCERTELPREERTVTLDGHEVRIKVRWRPEGRLAREDLSPEHDDLARVARATGSGLRSLEQRAIEAFLHRWPDGKRGPG
jgi:uncharacterized protein (TIGR00299 family) protein